MDKASVKLTFLNAVSSEGAGPAYVAAHPSGKYVLSANYAGGSLTVLPVEARRQLENRDGCISSQQRAQSGPRER